MLRLRKRRASMEPWHFSHGEGAVDERGRPPDIASMEPWHFSHGENKTTRTLSVRSTRFNGAMAF